MHRTICHWSHLYRIINEWIHSYTSCMVKFNWRLFGKHSWIVGSIFKQPVSFVSHKCFCIRSKRDHASWSNPPKIHFHCTIPVCSIELYTFTSPANELCHYIHFWWTCRCLYSVQLVLCNVSISISKIGLLLSSPIALSKF